MTHHTEAERPWWRDRADEIELQVGMGKMDAMACYTQMVQLLDAERRAPAAPVPQQVEAAIDALVFAAVIEGGVSNDRAKDAQAATHQRKAELLSMLAVAPQPPKVGCSVSNGETQEEPRAFETHVAAPVPQARKPLTDEECDRLISALCPDFTDERFPTDRPVMRQLARDAIAHSIGAAHGQ